MTGEDECITKSDIVEMDEEEFVEYAELVEKVFGGSFEMLSEFDIDDDVIIAQRLASLGIDDILFLDSDTFEDLIVADKVELFESGVIDKDSNYEHGWIIIKCEGDG